MRKIIFIAILIMSVSILSAVSPISIKIVDDSNDSDEVTAEVESGSSTVSEDSAEEKESASNNGGTSSSVSTVTNEEGTIIINNVININNKSNNVNNNVVESESKSKSDNDNEERDYSAGSGSYSGRGSSDKSLSEALDDMESIDEYEKKKNIAKYKKIRIAPGRLIAGEILSVFLPGSGFAHYLTGSAAGGILVNLMWLTGIGILIGNEYLAEFGHIKTRNAYHGIMAGGIIVMISSYLFDIIGGPVRYARYNRRVKRGLNLAKAVKRVNLAVNKDTYKMSFNYNF